MVEKIIRLRGFMAIGMAVTLLGCNEADHPIVSEEAASFRSSYKPMKREYWITTQLIPRWDAVPTGIAHMTGEAIHESRRYLHMALRYVATDSNWNPLPEPSWQMLSGPVIRATVGDSVIVHFKNGSNSGMPLSIHPHNVRYDAENEGVWRADMSEHWPEGETAGGSVQPGDVFTYRWVATEKSVGAGPYHSHSFRPAEEIGRGLIGILVVDLPPDHPEYIQFDTTVALIFKTYLAQVTGKDTTHAATCQSPLIPWNGSCHPKEHVPRDQWPENNSGSESDTAARGGGPELHTINGTAFSNLEGLRFVQDQKVRLVVVAMNDEGSQNHTIHFHGEMLSTMSDRKRFKDVFDLPSAYAQELILEAENVGNWMIHCHVEHHASEMMVAYEILPRTAVQLADSLSPETTNPHHH